MTINFKHAASLAAALLITPAAVAQDPALPAPDAFAPLSDRHPVGLKKVEPFLADIWTMQHKAGVAKSPQGIMPFPGDPEVHQFQFIHNGTNLVSISPKVAKELVFEWVEEPRWRFNAVSDGTRVFPPEFDDNELATVLGCDLSKAPRLKAQATVSGPNGAPMHFTYRLAVVNRDAMYGATQLQSTAQGVPVTIARPVTVSRVKTD
ncbi:hypothetical protein [Marimonas arenosa]|uniref:Uncharacterized protein n=1 Tax=Marimonas arenosa TaxID=1795305 RepID=A0AAE4B747_9RHOB|nr:hypothetical protein [Marimonas arenosa]MDQ2091086.1 hypothetical protein [Marimonas arenosa]